MSVQRSPLAALAAAFVLCAVLLQSVLVAAPARAAIGSGPPLGNFESARGGHGAITIKGWALDPDVTGSIYVWVTIDGTGRHVRADRARPDVAAAYPGAGANHGFNAELPAGPGSRRVCATAANVGPGEHRALGCRNVNVTAAGSPFGHLDGVRGVVGGVEVRGWAIDPDATGLGYVWVTVDGVGRHVVANASRPDVAAAYPGRGPVHGFKATIPASPGARTVCATAANVGPGEHRPLGCRRVYAVQEAIPFGSLEVVREVTGGIAVKGWAIDPDTTGAIYVWVTVDGVGRHVLANRTRGDLAVAYPDYGPRHGFSATMPAGNGPHRVCVTASNVGTGGHELLGCRSMGESSVTEAQRILAKFALPVGPVDGLWGTRTAQAMCTFRQMTGLPVSRGGLTQADLTKLRAYDAAYSSIRSVPAPTRSGRSTYLLATRTCQTMLYAVNGHYVRALRISTGKTGFESPTGRFRLGATYPGWSCSTIFPEACYDRPQGMNSRTSGEGVPYSTFGNMYNKRSFLGSFMLHGSGFVPSYPASHGCIRVSVADSDWLYRNVTNAGGRITFDVVGSY